MPLGVIDVKSEGHLPGTVILLDEDRPQAETSYLKHVDGKYGHIVLVPQPTNDPNEPLNWPLWKRNGVFMVVFINSIILASVPPPLLASSLTTLSTIFHLPLTKISKLSAYQLLVASVLGPIVSALARKWGKRPQFLFASFMGVLGTIVCLASTNSYNTLLTGRLLQGFGTTAYESLSLSVVGDLFFLHERGPRMGITVLTLTSVSAGVSVVAGPITENLGWRYMFIIYLPFAVVGFISAILFLPETQYVSPLPEQPTVEEIGDSGVKETAVHEEIAAGPAASVQSTTYKKKTYWQSLAITSGVHYPGSVFKLILAPFVTLLNPAVVWSICMSGIPICLFGSLSYIMAQIWSEPPYLLNAAQNGYFWSGALVGGFIAGALFPWLGDVSSKWLTERNGGIAEAEFVIPFSIVGEALQAVAWFVFMWDVNHPTPHGYYLGAICHGFLAAANTVLSTQSSLYILAAHRNMANEAFILSMMVKNFIFYGFAYFMNNWVDEDGAGDVFKIFGIVSCGCVVTSIPMYIFGKHNRKFVYGLAVLQRFTGVYD